MHTERQTDRQTDRHTHTQGILAPRRSAHSTRKEPSKGINLSDTRPLLRPPPWQSGCHGNVSKAVLSLLWFTRSVMSDSLRSRGLQHTRPPRPSSSRGLLKPTSSESVMPPNHLILYQYWYQGILWPCSPKEKKSWYQRGSLYFHEATKKVLPVIATFPCSLLDFLPLPVAEESSHPGSKLCRVLRLLLASRERRITELTCRGGAGV